MCNFTYFTHFDLVSCCGLAIVLIAVIVIVIVVTHSKAKKIEVKLLNILHIKKEDWQRCDPVVDSAGYFYISLLMLTLFYIQAISRWYSSLTFDCLSDIMFRQFHFSWYGWPHHIRSDQPFIYPMNGLMTWPNTWVVKVIITVLIRFLSCEQQGWQGQISRKKESQMFICFGIPDDLVHDVVITTLKYVVPAILFLFRQPQFKKVGIASPSVCPAAFYIQAITRQYTIDLQISPFYGIISPTTEKSYRRHPMCIPTIWSVCTATQRGWKLWIS